MFDKLTEANFLRLATSHSRVVVFKEVLGDQMTPVQVYQALQSHMKGATLLESSPKEPDAGRYSFLGFTPIAQLTVKNNDIQIKDEQGICDFKGKALDALRAFYQARRALNIHPLAGFAGGIVGFVAYDAARLFEERLQHEHEPNAFPDILFKCYQDHVMFDQKTGQVILATEVAIKKDILSEIYNTAIARLDSFHAQITANISSSSMSHLTSSLNCRTSEHEDDSFFESLDDASFIMAAEQAQQHIQKGDAFQIVLARTFVKKFTAKPFDIYRVLRYRNPSPYMFYIDNEDYIICGASPEKMISVKDNIVQSCPLAGTRQRGQDYDDAAQAADLLSDIKEVSEHMMLVDLARNDMGAVAKPGTVKVTRLKQIQQFSHVMHISSTVEAPLDDGKDALDALCAAFPAGTLSGAPKIPGHANH